MKRLIILLALSLVFVSCGTKRVENTAEPMKAEILSTSKPATEFSNPAYMGGSDMGNFFLAMLRSQAYGTALLFTSKESLQKYSPKQVLGAYQHFSYNYNLRLRSISGSTLKYTTNEFATGKFKTMNFVMENDTCKVVLGDKMSLFDVQ